METKTIYILGTEYLIDYKCYGEEPVFEKEMVAGYCDPNTKRLVICDLNTHPKYATDGDLSRQIEMKHTLRHEIVHAFLFESGLDCESHFSNAWGRDEEIVDWLAIQGVKLYNCWVEAGAV